MFWCLPDFVYDEILSSIIEIVSKYKSELVRYDWTMSKLDDKYQTLYAKYPTNDFPDINTLKHTKRISIEKYWDDVDNGWFENREEAENFVKRKIINNK